MEERSRWNTFKKEHRAKDPLGSKSDYRYYERMRAAYKAQRDRVTTLDPWLAKPTPSHDDELSDRPNR